jgi:hypothetical protein
MLNQNVTFFKNVGFVNYFLSTFYKMLQHFSEMLGLFFKKYISLPGERPLDSEHAERGGRHSGPRHGSHGGRGGPWPRGHSRPQAAACGSSWWRGGGCGEARRHRDHAAGPVGEVARHQRARGAGAHEGGIVGAKGRWQWRS